jgi:hypothetical protein
MKSERIELNTDSRNWIPDYLSDQWFACRKSIGRRSRDPRYFLNPWFYP